MCKSMSVLVATVTSILLYIVYLCLTRNMCLISFRNKNIKSVSLGFSKNKPILRISSSKQVNNTLTDSVTTQLTKYISEHHKSQCDKNEIEKMIKISLEHPMQVAEFQGGIPGGEFIMT